MAKDYGAEVFDLLTGFKYIGELITQLEAKGEADRFIVGMEESYGYLSGIHARDKDAVVASTLICEMAAYYKAKGKSLYEVMQDLYAKYGMYLNTLLNYGFEGAAGMKIMAGIMDTLRENPPKAFGGMEVLKVADYKKGYTTDCRTGAQTPITLPRSNVIAFLLPNNNKVIARPSGTEPKIKFYLTAVADNRAAAEAVTALLRADVETYVK